MAASLSCSHNLWVEMAFFEFRYPDCLSFFLFIFFWGGKLHRFFEFGSVVLEVHFSSNQVLPYVFLPSIHPFLLQVAEPPSLFTLKISLFMHVYILLSHQLVCRLSFDEPGVTADCLVSLLEIDGTYLLSQTGSRIDNVLRD